MSCAFWAFEPALIQDANVTIVICWLAEGEESLEKLSTVAHCGIEFWTDSRRSGHHRDYLPG